MNYSIHRRAAATVVALLIGGLVVAGCSDQERPVDAIDEPVATLSTGADQPGPVGAAAAKGAELTAVAIVRGWISARNATLGGGYRPAVEALTAPDCSTCGRFLRGDRWSVVSTRVSQHTVDTATVLTRVSSRSTDELALEFEVARVGGKPVVTRIVRPSTEAE